MKPYPFIPGVPSAGHISRGHWHPGRPENCPKCSTTTQPAAKKRTLAMKLSLALAALLAVTLTGCTGDDDQPAASNDYSESLGAIEDDPVGVTSDTEKAQVRDLLRSEHPDVFGHFTDDSLDDLAERTCEGFDDGLTVNQVFLAGSPAFGSEIGAVMAASTIAYCPEYNSMVEAWANSH